jgi:outer membrane protein TolC
MPPTLEPPTGDPAAVTQQIVERQPEILAAQAQFDRARHALVLEKAKRLPDPTLTAGYKRTGGADRNEGNIDRAIAEEHAAAMELAAVRKQQIVATQMLIQSAQELEERVRSIDQQMLQPAEVVRNAARAAFHEGASNILQLVDAERVYTDTRREALELKLEAYTKAFAARLVLTEERQP